jgi:hypothetical protein
MKEELKFTNIGNKESQKELITEIMDLDAKDGLYEDDVEKLAEQYVNTNYPEYTNPKEKALELYRKFEDGITGVEGTDWWKSAEQCALIAVDEVLQYSKAHGFIELTEYYEEVKKEIQNI